MKDKDIQVFEDKENDIVAMSQEDFSRMAHFALAKRYRDAVKIIRHNFSLFDELGYSKDRIFRWLKRPEKYEGNLRKASRALYNSNGQYMRLCNYQPNMVKMPYVIIPLAKNSDVIPSSSEYKKNYELITYLLDCMNIRTEFGKPLSTVMRDGIVFGYARTAAEDAFSIFILDPDHCRTTSIDGFGCIRFEFDFSYFDGLRMKAEDIDVLVASWGKEFVDKYEAYKKNRAGKRWQEISEDGMCFKYQEDILEYSIPPYIAVLDNLFDLDDYRKLAKAREETGNYNLLNYRVPTNKDGKVLMDAAFAQKFIDQASSEVPDTIGIIYSPMQVDKISFSKETTVADRNAVTEAIEQFWAASGVSDLLFGSGKSSANALAKSIIADEINIHPLVRQVERWINRRLRLQRGKYKFKIKILDVTYFNDRDTFDTLLKAGNAGTPVKTAMAATLGFSPYDVLMMAKLENDVLHMRDTVFNQPLLSANTMSGSNATSGEGGRPMVDDDDLSPSGEATRENDGNVRE